MILHGVPGNLEDGLEDAFTEDQLAVRMNLSPDPWDGLPRRAGEGVGALFPRQHAQTILTF